MAPRVNQFAGNFGFNLTSGSLASALGGGGAEARDNDSYRTRASMSYVSGGHHTKIGWDGGYYMQDQTNQMNDSRLFYRYSKPATTCVTAAPLGDLPVREHQPAVPGGSVQPGAAAGSAERAVLHRRRRPSAIESWYGAFYAQDQWTLQRFTFSGALRYDHAESRYLETCIGGANEPYMPVQSDGTKRYRTPDSHGVSYQRHHAAMGRGVGRLRHGPDVGEVEHGQVQQPGGHHRDLLRRQSGAAHGQRSAARHGPTATATALLTAT